MRTGSVLARLLGLWLGLFLLASTCLGAEPDQSRPDPEGTPTTVRIFLYVADISSVDDAAQAFEADLVLAADWQDSRLAGRWPGSHVVDVGDIWNPRLLVMNRHGASSLLPERAEVLPTGHVRIVQRLLGRFSVRMNLRDFPVDRQRFDIRVTSLGYSRGEVDLVPLAMPDVPYRAGQLSVTDWIMGPAQMQKTSFALAPGAKTLAGVDVAWEGERRFAYYGVQVFLPLLTIVFMGWTALLLDQSSAATRISVSTTTMLTLIAYRFAIGNEIPHLAYLTRFDLFMLGATILVFVTLMVVAVGAYLTAHGRSGASDRMDRGMRAAFPIAFVVMTMLVWSF